MPTADELIAQWNRTGQGDNSVDSSLAGNITSSNVPGRWSETTANGSNAGYQISPGYTQNVYKGPGGTFTQGRSGTWDNGMGKQINDLSGYLSMKNKQASGADFSGYQAGVNTALNDQSNWNSMYRDLITDPSKIQQTAGYQFALDQGNQAINRSAASKGMLNSGNVLAELARYGQGMASTEYDKQLARTRGGAELAGGRVNSLGGLMSNAQSFGVQSGYYPGAAQTQQDTFNRQGTPTIGSRPATTVAANPSYNRNSVWAES